MSLRNKTKKTKRSEEEEPKCTRLSPDQINYLLDYLARHSLFANRGDLGARSVDKYNAMWKNLAEEISSLGPTVKTSQQLEDSWVRLKARARDQYQAYIKAFNSTGNPTAPPEPSETSKKILSLIGTQTIVGIPGISPSGFGPIEKTPNPDGEIPKNLAVPSASSVAHQISHIPVPIPSNSNSTSLNANNKLHNFVTPKKRERETASETFEKKLIQRKVSSQLAASCEETVSEMKVQNQLLLQQNAILERIAKTLDNICLSYSNKNGLIKSKSHDLDRLQSKEELVPFQKKLEQKNHYQDDNIMCDEENNVIYDEENNTMLDEENNTMHDDDNNVMYDEENNTMLNEENNTMHNDENNVMYDEENNIMYDAFLQQSLFPMQYDDDNTVGNEPNIQQLSEPSLYYIEKTGEYSTGKMSGKF